MPISSPRVMPRTPFEQDALGGGPVAVSLTTSDLADGLLDVSTQKGIRTRSATICDDQFYDTSVLIMLVELPRADVAQGGTLDHTEVLSRIPLHQTHRNVR